MQPWVSRLKSFAEWNGVGTETMVPQEGEIICKWHGPKLQGTRERGNEGAREQGTKGAKAVMSQGCAGG
jgi:hypothetical protein